MKKHNFFYLLLGGLIFAFLVVFNGVLFYYTECTKDTLSRSRTVGSTVITRAATIEASRRFSELPSDFSEALEILNEEYHDVGEEMRLLNVELDNSEFPTDNRDNLRYKMNELEHKLAVNLCCAEIIQYCDERSGLFGRIEERYLAMKEVSLFDGYGIRNIEKTYSDFIMISDVEPVPVSDAGYEAIFGFHSTDVFVGAFSIAISVVFLFSLKSRIKRLSLQKNLFGIFLIVLFILSAVFYITDIMLAAEAYGIEKLFAPLISLESFAYCIYDISIGSFLVIWVVFKALFSVLLSAAFVTIVSKPKSVISIITAVILAVQGIFAFNNIPSVFGLLNADKLFGEYENINLFSEPVSAQLITFILIAVILTASVITAYVRMAEYSKKGYETAQKAYYDDITEKYNSARIMRHDMKNHFIVLSYLLESGETEKAKDYLGDLVSETGGTGATVRTGSLILDALIFNKNELANKKGAELKLDFDADLSESKITDFDLCTIFGNILDNAIEAVEKLPPEKRTITLSVKRKGEMVFIFSENGYDTVNSRFETTKSDKLNHGNGLNSIKKAAEKYSGSSDISAENGVFTISVMLTF